MSGQGNSLYTLSTIIKSSRTIATIHYRLEAVASRIEDVADIQEQRAGISNPNAGSSQTTPVPAPPPPPPPPPPPAVIEDPKAAIAYDEAILEGKLKPFIELTNSFGSDALKEQVSLLEPLFGAIRQVVHTAGSCIQPPSDEFLKLLGPVQSGYEAVSLVKEKNSRDREWSLHYSVIATGASCVSWITDSKPGPFVQGIKEETEFYGNRLIKDYKEKDAKHLEWTRAFTGLLQGLKEYIAEYHTTGLSWNPKGISLSEYKAIPATDGAPPPPPPPPPAPGPAPVQASGSGGVAAVFAELNRGADVTKGLRKVEKSEMTHKNPALRETSTVPSNTSPPLSKKPTKPAKPQSLSTKKPAKFALEGNKWVIEYQENEPGLMVENAEISQVITLYGCKNTTVVIKGKVNGVTIVNCIKTSVLVDSVISSVSVTASPSFVIQITGSAPTIQLDSTDSGQIYLSKNCLGVEIITAKCSAINVSLPVEGEEEGVFEEKPIPEMLRTTVHNGALVTGVVEHTG
ncbi:adenylate cyclase associated N terminal-domain-containing protein [Thelephora terrestris]|uniref:Adenylyl cyclase-associated protein n=1 Tax=Thelephora terrestris TaxID=56493 RepID=A0A9P6HQW7_9AGAM|nr:adenylate cyclase associated N terminal-domain-containing protein [Thelephora terrestris]